MPRVAEKRWLIMVVMLGLVASLLGAGDQQAAATHGTDPDVDFEATYSACAGAAADPAGFEDTAGSFAEDAINCLAHYGVTQGRTPTTYAPNDSVLRWQMALFLARAAAPAGIVLENPATDQGFTDIGGVSDSARNAINGLAAAGIMPGVTATAFFPNRAVTRASMAMLLDGFLRAARPGTGAFGSNAAKYSEVVSDNNAVFNDISGVSILEFNAIGRIYELGITRGVGDHQFGPGGLVTRAQMAAFITRALAHTIARPAGVSVQASQETVKGAGSSVDLLISVRDAAFEPLADTTVDVFSSTDVPAAFDDDGSCASEKVTGVAGATVCRLDRNDEITDITGDITDLTLDGISAATTVWAWTGDVGDSYDSETDSSSATVGFIKAATKVLLSDDLEPNQSQLRLGETVKFTFQVADEDDSPAAEPGYQIPITISESTVAGAITGSSRTYLTDAQGRVELSFTQAGTNAAGETAKVSLQIGGSAATKPGVSGSLPVVDMTTNKAETVGDDAGKYVARWSEGDSVPTTLTISPGNSFTLASDTGRGASNMVTATLTDQYGAGVRGARISFRSDDQNGAGGAGDGLKVTVAQEPPNVQRSVAGGEIVLEVSPAYVAVGESNVEFTVTARRTTGETLFYPQDISYRIQFPHGVTFSATGSSVSCSDNRPAPGDPPQDASCERIRTGVVTIPGNQLSGSIGAEGVRGVADTVAVCPRSSPPPGCRPRNDLRDVHHPFTLNVPAAAEGLGIGFFKVGNLQPVSSPQFDVSSARAEIVASAAGETVKYTIVSIGGVTQVVPCDQFPRLIGSDLPGGVAPVRCLTGEPRNNNQRTTNRSGKAVFAYSRDDDAGGLETIWASYAATDGQLLTDRVYQPWSVETEGNVRGRILAADADNDRAVILPGSGIPELVRYDRNDQLSSIDGLDVYANFDTHMSRVEGDRLPGYLAVGIYASSASGISRISLYGQSTYQPTRDIAGSMHNNAAVAASGNGVVAIGAPDKNEVYVYSGPGDQTPQILTQNERTPYELASWETVAHRAVVEEITATTGIVLSVSWANKVRKSNPIPLPPAGDAVTYTITARQASGTAESAARTVNYTIVLPTGVTSVDQMGSCLDSLVTCTETDDVDNTLTGSVSIAANEVSGSTEHAELPLSGAAPTSDLDHVVRITGTSTSPSTVTVHPTTIENVVWFHRIIRPNLVSSFGTDVAISDDGSTIVVGDPQRSHTLLPSSEHGAAYVYTRGAGGQYRLAATLNNDYYYDSSNPNYPRNEVIQASLNFGAGVDISGDGRTIAVASPGGGYIPPVRLRSATDPRFPLFPGTDLNNPPRPCTTVNINCEIGHIQVYSKPAGGWQDDNGSASSGSFSLVPRQYAGFSTYVEPPPLELGKYRSVSVSYSGSVVSAGGPWTSTVVPDGMGDTVEYEEAGGVFVWERPADGWSATLPNSYDGLLALNLADGEDFGWVGAGARLSADGNVVVFSGNHQETGDPKAELYAFPKPAGGWANSTTYQTLTLSDLPDGEVFGQWVDVDWDGSEIITNRHTQPLGDYRGAVQVFARSSNGTWEPGGGYLGDAGGGFGRYAAIGGDNSIVAADQFGGKVTWISRAR